MPRRTISGERIRVARRIRDVPAPEITLGFSDEEPPTASVPKPILNMLLRSMLSQDAAATAPGASHGPSNVRVPADPEIQISVQPVSEEPPPKEASEQPPQEREIVSKRRHSTRGLWIAVSVILAGTAGYAALRFAESRLPEHERAPAPALAHEPARDAGVPSLQPAELQPLDSSLPVAAMPLHTAIDPNAATSLLSIDGSEATAPSCDDLVGNAPTTGAHSFRDHLRAARSAIVRGDTDGSQRALCRAIRVKDAPPAVSIELARLLLMRRDAPAALDWVKQASQLTPESPRLLELTGDAAVRAGRLDEARSAWLRAERLNESDARGIERMLQRLLASADVSLKERDPARAERLLRRVIAFRPNHAGAHAKLAVALRRLGFVDSAARWSRRGADLAG